ncbi:hypothetical protein [Actinoplanes sp. NPDC026670]|uniref:hypothetical protein n=1 Tax=Actinoplanes sp. NPDC026670 TaxID=3154700 RepID=UPI003406EE8F
MNRDRRQVAPAAGVVAGPVRVTAATVPTGSVPGLVAVSAAALICVAAWAGRALTGEIGSGLLAAGVITPLLVVAAVVVAHRRYPAPSGADTVWEFTVRAGDGTRIPVLLRTGAPRGSLRPRDQVRLVPARPGRRGVPARSGRGRAVQAVEVLAGPDGPVLRRIAASPALSPVQRAGLFLAVLLLAATVATLLTA